MVNSPKHREVSRQLRVDIAAGRYVAGARLPGEPQLVKRFGVSRPTVGRALLDLQSEGLIERRAGSGTYVKGGAGEQAASSTRQLGPLIPGLGNTEIFELICGELASLVPRGMRVVGFDDVKYATLVSPALTTIHQPCRDIATVALRLMLERIAEPTLPARSVGLTPHLVLRESCGAYLPRSG